MTLPVLRKLAEDARLEGRRHLPRPRDEILELDCGRCREQGNRRAPASRRSRRAHLRNIYAKIGAQTAPTPSRSRCSSSSSPACPCSIQAEAVRIADFERCGKIDGVLIEGLSPRTIEERSRNGMG